MTATSFSQQGCFYSLKLTA